jgi:hypothetical protein
LAIRSANNHEDASGGAGDLVAGVLIHPFRPRGWLKNGIS